MNNYGVRTTVEEKESFPFNDYPLITKAGIFTVTLMDKCWGQGAYLICAFKTEDNVKFRVNVWRRFNEELYAPKKTLIDFSKVSIGSTWICTFILSKNGNIYWKDATPSNITNPIDSSK